MRTNFTVGISSLQEQGGAEAKGNEGRGEKEQKEPEKLNSQPAILSFPGWFLEPLTTA